MCSILKPGDIVRFNIINRQYADEGFALGGVHDTKKNKLILYEEIDVENFPSFSDFKGKPVVVEHGSYGMIIKKIGRPWRINQNNKKWEIYDIYEVFTTKLSMCQVFRINIVKAF
jgi:hypothetical protein